MWALETGDDKLQTGYMFGKGIYFADMVSKSANYCCVNKGQGLLLLCEVALGEMQEEKQANYIKKLQSGKNSCKGNKFFNCWTH